MSLPEHLDQGQRDRNHHRAEHDAEDAKHLQPTENREEDQQLVQPRPSSDQSR